MQTSGKSLLWKLPASRGNEQAKTPRFSKPQRTPVLVGLKESPGRETFGSGSFHTQGYKSPAPSRWRHRRNRGLARSAGRVGPPAHSQLTLRAGPLSKTSEKAAEVAFPTRTNTTERDCSKSSTVQHCHQAGWQEKTALLIILFPQKKIMFSQLLSYIERSVCAAKRSERITPSAQVDDHTTTNFAGFCCFVVVITVWNV